MTAQRGFFDDLDLESNNAPSSKNRKSSKQTSRSFFDDLDIDNQKTDSEAVLGDNYIKQPKETHYAPTLKEKDARKSFFEDVDRSVQDLPEPKVITTLQQPTSEDKESFLDRFGRGLSYTAQSTNAVTPEGAGVIAKNVPGSLLEGATAGFFQQPKSEEPGERVIQEASRITGELGLIHGAGKFLNAIGINPQNWYQRIAMGGTVGAGLSAAKQAAYTGHVDPKEVAIDAALWAGLDAGLELIHGIGEFRRAVNYISGTTGKDKSEVLSFLKDRLMARFRGKPQPEPEVLGREALSMAEEAANEAKAAEVIPGQAETISPEQITHAEPEIPHEIEPPKTLDESVQSKVISETEAPSETLSLKERFQDYENRFLNQFAPLDRLAEDSEVFENPGQLAELVEGAAGQAKQALEHGQFDINTLETTGPGLKQIFEPRRILEIEGKKKLDRKAFRAYLAARSSLDRAKLGQKTAIPVDEAAQYISKHKRYEPLAREYSAFLNQNLTNLRKAGLLTPEAEKAMREMYLNYAPLHRLVDKPKRVSRRSLQPEKLPKKAKGSTRTILDPLESAVKNTAATYRAIAKNRVMNAVRNKLEPLGYKVKPAPRPQFSKEHLAELMGDESPDNMSDRQANQLSQIKGVLDPESYNPGEGKIFGYRNGERWEMEAPQDIIDAVKGLNPAQSSFVIELANKWRRFFSGGVVLQPGTMMRISGMDLIVSTLQSKYPTIPVLDLPINVFYHFPKMLFETISKGELYQDYLKSGAAQFALQGLDRESVDAMVSSLTKSESNRSIWQSTKDIIKAPFKALSYVAEKLGDAPRLLEFKKSYDSAIGRGLTRQQALAQAAHDAFEVSVPYGRMGNSAALQEMYKVVPFMRTIVNSNMTFAQAMDPRNPNFMKMMATALAGLTLPTLYFYMRNRNDERYQRIPQEERDKNLYIYNTDDPHEEPIKLRKMWQFGFVFQTLPERVVEFMAQKDPKAFEKLFKNFEYEYSPFTFLNFSSAIEDGFHPDKIFEGSRFHVIPEKQKRIDASLQHSASTSETAKKLGALTNVSPIYVDFIIGQTGGGLGKNVARLFDEAMYFTGYAEDRRAESKHADNMAWGTFFGRGPTKSSEYLQRFYRLHDKMEMTKATIKQLEKEGHHAEAVKYAETHPFIDTGWMRTRMGGYFKKADEIMLRPSTTETDKKRKRIELDKLYIDMAQQARAFEMSIETGLYHKRHGDESKSKRKSSA